MDGFLFVLFLIFYVYFIASRRRLNRPNAPAGVVDEDTFSATFMSYNTFCLAELDAEKRGKYKACDQEELVTVRNFELGASVQPTRNVLTVAFRNTYRRMPLCCTL